jgi:hypothetical protein
MISSRGRHEWHRGIVLMRDSSRPLRWLRQGGAALVTIFILGVIDFHPAVGIVSTTKSICRIVSRSSV